VLVLVLGIFLFFFRLLQTDVCFCFFLITNYLGVLGFVA
jgi:hypothetical protein